MMKTREPLKILSIYNALSTEDDVKNMERLIELLEDNEDVQNVWHNWQQD